MVTYPFNAWNHAVYFSPKEGAFGDKNNNATLDETNGATDVFFPLGLELTRTPYITLKKIAVAQHIQGVGPDPGYFGYEGYGDGAMELYGNLQNLSLMYFACKACTTTDNVTPATDTTNPPATAAAGYYTHDYLSTTARAAAPPSFELLFKLVNDDTNQTKILLYTGCIVTGFVITGSKGGMLQCTYKIQFRNCIAGTALTAPGYPADLAVNCFDIGKAVLTYTKGGTAYSGSMNSIMIEYLDGAYLNKAGGNDYPAEALNGYRKVTVKFEWMPHTKNHLDDTLTAHLAPAAASDVDVKVKISRNPTNDWLMFLFEKVWNIDRDDPTWDDLGKLVHNCTFICKSTGYEAGAYFWVRQVDIYDDDRYET